METKMIAIISTVLLVALDQVTKRLAYTYLQPIGSVPVTTFFSLTYLENSGAAFGVLYGARWFFIVFTIVALGYMIYLYRSVPSGKPHHWTKIALILFISGAIGNFIDRLFFGPVIDFFHVTFINFPVFNIADIFITVGAVIYAATTLLIKEEQ